MYWANDEQMSSNQLRAKLLFYYHKIEKGICMPGEKRLFAVEVVPLITHMLTIWEDAAYSREDPIYIGAISSLRSYSALLHMDGLDPEQAICASIDEFLARRMDIRRGFAETPITITDKEIGATVSHDAFRSLCELRRSFRDFDTRKVSEEGIRWAVELAQLSPSACNRQPCKVYVVSNEDTKRVLLSHQNGNSGFGHLAPMVLVLTSDSSHFFGAIERHQPYVDGGLFSMSLLYGLQVQGLVSCCLNWCVTPATDAAVHQLLDIPNAERIVMLVLVGYPVEKTVVPKSQRKAVDSVLVFK